MIFKDTMASMTWKEIEAEAENDAIVLFPVGVIEEHGPHLTLAIDSLCSYLLCKHIRKELEKKQIPSLISPPYYWGINNATAAFPGSFTIRKETFRNIIVDLLHCLHRWGFNNIFLINWHGDREHIFTLVDAISEARINFGVRCYILLTEYEIKRLKISCPQPLLIEVKYDPPIGDDVDIHAGSDEVSVILNYFPEHVNDELASQLEPTNLTKDDLKIWNKGWTDTRKLIPEGYFGNPSKFSREKGKKIIEEISIKYAKQIFMFLKENQLLIKKNDFKN